MRWYRYNLFYISKAVAIQFRALFWHIWYCKVWQAVITKCVRYHTCDRIYYKVCEILQSVTVITKWDVTFVQTTRNSISIFDNSFKYFQIFWVSYTVGQRISDFWHINFDTFCYKSNLILFGNIKIKFVFIYRKSLRDFEFEYFAK